MKVSDYIVALLHILTIVAARFVERYLAQYLEVGLEHTLRLRHEVVANAANAVGLAVFRIIVLEPLFRQVFLYECRCVFYIELYVAEFYHQHRYFPLANTVLAALGIPSYVSQSVDSRCTNGAT